MSTQTSLRPPFGSLESAQRLSFESPSATALCAILVVVATVTLRPALSVAEVPRGVFGVIPGTLTIQKTLTLMADATYQVTLNSTSVTADEVSANGVGIRGAQILLDDRATNVLQPGTVFTVIYNNAATPIAGTFANLTDGATVVVGNNTFQANYEDGDGNDLTLTVVP